MADDVIAPGFTGETRVLTIRIVRVLFPGMGLLALSAWSLGILNSHRRFFLPYAAPVMWNVAIIASLVAYGGRVADTELAVVAAWGSVIGSALQLLVQLPVVLKLLHGVRPNLEASVHVRTVARTFSLRFSGAGPHRSERRDSSLASLLPIGAVAGSRIAATYNAPREPRDVASRSRSTGDGERHRALTRCCLRGSPQRLHAGLRRIAYLVVPSRPCFSRSGDVVAARCSRPRIPLAAIPVRLCVLAGSAVGLLASHNGRLYSSAFLHCATLGTRFVLRGPVCRCDNHRSAAGASTGEPSLESLCLGRRGHNDRIRARGVGGAHAASLRTRSRLCTEERLTSTIARLWGVRRGPQARWVGE